MWRSFWQSTPPSVPGVTVRFPCQHSPQYRSAGASLQLVWPRVRRCSHADSALFAPYTDNASAGAAICFAIDCHTWRAKVRCAQRYHSGRVLHPIRELSVQWYISWYGVIFWQWQRHLNVEMPVHTLYFFWLRNPYLSCKTGYFFIIFLWQVCRFSRMPVRDHC